jgi:hypothetical protein
MSLSSHSQDSLKDEYREEEDVGGDGSEVNDLAKAVAVAGVASFPDIGSQQSVGSSMLGRDFSHHIGDRLRYDGLVSPQDSVVDPIHYQPQQCQQQHAADGSDGDGDVARGVGLSSYHITPLSSSHRYGVQDDDDSEYIPDSRKRYTSSHRQPSAHGYSHGYMLEEEEEDDIQLADLLDKNFY